LDVGGQMIDVFGISGEDIGRILERYPDAFQQMAMSGGQPSRMDGGLLGALLAASQRNGSAESLLGNERAEQMGRSHSVGDQMKMIQAVGRCTFPDGISPFLESLVLNSSSVANAMQVVVEVASKVPDIGLQPKPRPSAQPGTPPSGS